MRCTQPAAVRFSLKGARPAGVGLKGLLAVGAGLLISTLVVVLSFTIEAAATRKLERQIGLELQELAFHMHDNLHRGLSGRLRNLRLAATLDPLVDPETSPRSQAALLRWLRHVNAEYAWIGLVDVAGRVIVSTSGQPIDADVAREQWFRRGLQGPYVGAVKASAALPGVTDSGQNRFVDFAAPVMKGDEVVGVLGAHVSWAWAEEVERSLLAPLRKRRGTETIVLDAEGIVLLGPPDLIGTRLDVPSARAARAGNTGYTTTAWPDDETYVTGFSPGSRAAQASGLGWLVLARQKAAVAFDPVDELRRHLLVWGAVTAVLFVLLGWLGAKWIATPLRALTAAADRLKQGSDDETLPTSARYAEVASLSGSLAALLASLRENEARLRIQALHDPLTGLPNRILLRDRLSQAVAQSRRTKRPAALLLLDLDRFKDINDTLGHPTGDRLLVEAARRLTVSRRATDTVARLGGDEFALVLFDLQHAGDVATVARKVVGELSRPFHLEGQELHVGASAGIAICPTDGSDADQLLRHADLALYRAKASGGHACRFFAPAMAAEMTARKELERDLRLAVQRGELELHYQPQLDMRSGRMRGAEALLRWKQEVHGWMHPAEFIPVAEASGLMGPIGAWTLREACRQAKAWRGAGLKAVKIAINLSPAQCRRGDLASTVEATLQEVGLPFAALELEVTESAFACDTHESVLADLHHLHAAGVTVAIDDFGTGYSSLGRLRTLPVDKVKVGRSFVARLGQEAGAEAIVRAILALAHGLGLRVTAEGVETEFQLEFLRAAGCEGAQGSLVGQPVKGDEFVELSRLYSPLDTAAESLRRARSSAWLTALTKGAAR